MSTAPTTKKSEEYTKQSPKALPLEVKANGTVYTQIKREGNIALYRGHLKPSGQPERGYEIIKIRVKPSASLKGTLVPWREAYPSSSEWGRYGLSTISREFAEKLFRQEVENEAKGKPFNQLTAKER